MIFTCHSIGGGNEGSDFILTAAFWLKLERLSLGVLDYTKTLNCLASANATRTLYADSVTLPLTVLDGRAASQRYYSRYND